MSALILRLEALQSPLRIGLGLLLTVASLLALLSWLERTRRVSAFGGIARFARRRLDPNLAAVDRMVARAGGRRTSAPWWALFLLLVAGATFIAAVDFLREVLTTAYFATSMGPRGIVGLAVRWTLGLLQLAILVRIVTSWVGGSYSWAGRRAFAMTEWLLAPLRRVLPPFGAVDFTPLLAWFAISLLRGVLTGAL